MPITESHVEPATLAWLKELDYTLLEGPAIAPEQEPSLSDLLRMKPTAASTDLPRN